MLQATVANSCISRWTGDEVGLLEGAGNGSRSDKRGVLERLGVVSMTLM